MQAVIAAENNLHIERAERSSGGVIPARGEERAPGADSESFSALVQKITDEETADAKNGEARAINEEKSENGAAAQKQPKTPEARVALQRFANDGDSELYLTASRAQSAIKEDGAARRAAAKNTRAETEDLVQSARAKTDADLEAADAQESDTDTLKENSTANAPLGEEVFSQTPVKSASDKSEKTAESDAARETLKTAEEFNPALNAENPYEQSALTGAAQNSPASRTKNSNDKIVIIDQRSNAVSAANDAANVSLERDGAQVRSEITIALPETSAQSKSNAGKSAPVSFAGALASELQNNVPDIVQRGTLILRDNGSGVIRLTLKPETLGSVKIKLELTDNGIAGRIAVSSEDAFRAFRENIDGLKAAFAENGFDCGSLELGYQNEQGGENQGQNERYGGKAAEIGSPVYGDELIDAAPFYAIETRASVNIVA